MCCCGLSKLAALTETGFLALPIQKPGFSCASGEAFAMRCCGWSEVGARTETGFLALPTQKPGFSCAGGDALAMCFCGLSELAALTETGFLDGSSRAARPETRFLVRQRRGVCHAMLWMERGGCAYRNRVSRWPPAPARLRPARRPCCPGRAGRCSCRCRRPESPASGRSRPAASAPCAAPGGTSAPGPSRRRR